jgi:hypothetical protein
MATYTKSNPGDPSNLLDEVANASPAPAKPVDYNDDELETVTLTQLVVIIDRDASTKLPATIFDYELPILQRIYGEDQVAEESEEDVEVASMTANEAHEALRRKYAQHIDDVIAVYPRPAALAKVSGLDVVDEGNRGKLAQSTVTDHKKLAPKPATKSTKKTAKKTAGR